MASIIKNDQILISTSKAMAAASSQFVPFFIIAHRCPDIVPVIDLLVYIVAFAVVARILYRPTLCQVVVQFYLHQFGALTHIVLARCQRVW